MVSRVGTFHSWLPVAALVLGGCLGAEVQIRETADSYRPDEQHDDPIVSHDLEAQSHTFDAAGELQVRFVTKAKCAGTVVHHFEKVEVTTKSFRDWAPCSAGALVLENLLGLGLSAAMITLDPRNKSGLAVAGGALAAVPLGLDIACIVQSRKRRPVERSLGPDSRPTDSTESYSCTRPNQAARREVAFEIDTPDGKAVGWRNADVQGVTKLDLFRVVDAHSPPNNGVTIRFDLGPESEPVAMRLSRAELQTGARRYLASRYEGTGEGTTNAITAGNIQPTFWYQSARGGKAVNLGLRISSEREASGIYATVGSKSPELNGRYLYFGHVPSAGSAQDSLILDRAPEAAETQLPELRVRLFQATASGSRLVSEFDVGSDAGGPYGDWDSGPDRAKTGAKRITPGPWHNGEVDGRGGDLTDWYGVSFERRGRVQVTFEGDAELGRVVGGEVPAYEVEPTSSGKRVTFFGGEGSYYFSVRSPGSTSHRYRVKADLLPIVIKGQVIDRQGDLVVMNRGKVDGVYVGQQGTFFYRTYKAGTFRVKHVGPAESGLEVTSGQGEVFNRLKSLTTVTR